MAHLVEDERGRSVTARVDELLELLSLDDLSSGIARVRSQDDLKSLSPDILLYLFHVQMVPTIHI